MTADHASRARSPAPFFFFCRAERTHAAPGGFWEAKGFWEGEVSGGGGGENAGLWFWRRILWLGLAWILGYGRD